MVELLYSKAVGAQRLQPLWWGIQVIPNTATVLLYLVHIGFEPMASSSASGGSSAVSHKRDPLLTLVAGCLAGGIEATATWPLEYIKTQMQAKRKIVVRSGPASGVVSVPQPYTTIVGGITHTVRTNGFFSLYTGLTPTLLLSLPKVGIRFGANQQLRNLFRSDNGNVSIGASFSAGTLAGIAEAILVVTPQETIKTKLIRLNMGAYRGIQHILKTDGPGGLYLGVVSTCLKQGGSNGVRFLFMSEWTRFLKGTPEASLKPVESFVGGCGAGLGAVLLTQPFDVVKTRQQSGIRTQPWKSGQSSAPSTIEMLRQIVRHEGAATLMSGTVARCARVLPGSGIIFMCTDYIYAALHHNCTQ